MWVHTERHDLWPMWWLTLCAPLIWQKYPCPFKILELSDLGVEPGLRFVPISTLPLMAMSSWHSCHVENRNIISTRNISHNQTFSKVLVFHFTLHFICVYGENDPRTARIFPRSADNCCFAFGRERDAGEAWIRTEEPWLCLYVHKLG